MKHFSPILLTLLLFTLPSAANGQAQSKDAEANKSLLWRISGKGLKTPSYLFGTMHAICAEDYFWTEKMEQSLGKCQSVCFEMNLNDPQLQAKAMAAVVKLITGSMKDMIPQELMGEVEKMMSDSMMKNPSAMGIDPAKLNLSAFGALPCDSTKSYEENIMAKALKANKTIAGLEDIDEGVELLGKLLGSMPLDSLMQMLNGSSASPEEKAEYKTMIAFYKKQDVPGLYNYIAAAKDNVLNTDIFLDERNKKWVPRMAKQMEVGSVFFGVGAGHLWGKNGLISLLRLAGYKVDPVK